MGKVYLARNWKTQQTVALKLIRDELASNELAVRRFQREIRALSKVNHPNIVSVYDADAVSDVIYYAMELVEGIDLGRVLQKSGPLNVARACEFAQQVALALESLYQAGLVHRDIKPSNLLLAKREQHIKLLDLGLARFQPDHQQYSGNLTRLGILIGTPDYISPEQIQDPRSATIRSDLYSLGCTLYHLLAGRAPFESVPVVDKLYHQCFSQPKPIEQLRGDLPKPLVKLIHRLLEKKPRRRYRRPAHVAWALEDVMRLLAPFDSNTNIVLESKLVRKFEKFEENLMPATECFKEIPTPKLLKKFSDTDSHHSLQLGV
jgi:serine/threonine protein kinase